MRRDNNTIMYNTPCNWQRVSNKESSSNSVRETAENAVQDAQDSRPQTYRWKKYYKAYRQALRFPYHIIKVIDIWDRSFVGHRCYAYCLILQLFQFFSPVRNTLIFVASEKCRRQDGEWQKELHLSGTSGHVCVQCWWHKDMDMDTNRKRGGLRLLELRPRIKWSTPMAPKWANQPHTQPHILGKKKKELVTTQKRVSQGVSQHSK